MFGGLTDMPRLSSYREALAHYEYTKPIAGKGVNAGIRPLCDTANGRRKAQYSIRKKKLRQQVSKPSSVFCMTRQWLPLLRTARSI